MTTEPDNPRPRRRWLQFSLRTFFVLVTVFCVCIGSLGVAVYRGNEQRKVAEWVREIGGTVAYEHEYDENSMFMDDDKPPWPRWLAERLGEDYFDDVTSVDLGYTQVSDLAPLAILTRLESVRLNNTAVTDLTPLTRLTSLTTIFVNDTSVRDLTPLAELKDLMNLFLDDTQVRDLTPLAELTNLRMLYLNKTPVSKEQVEELRKALPNCEIHW